MDKIYVNGYVSKHTCVFCTTKNAYDRNMAIATVQSEIKCVLQYVLFLCCPDGKKSLLFLVEWENV